ncbi:MAG TPA: hypothetical protein VFR18_20885 [Terriglobia bacterium]|nr:hypothetical protein [Terriglobia bacterium]
MLSISTVKAETRDWCVLVRVSLQNGGESVVGPGTMLGRYTSTGGAVRLVEFRNSNNIDPGCTAEVRQLLSAMTELEFTGYRQSDGVVIPFSGGVVKRLSFLRSVAVAISRGWDEVLRRSTSLVARLRALYATAWMRLEIDRRANHGAEVAAKTWQSFNAELVRSRDDILLPRIGSIAARLKALHENALLRLADAKEKRKHRAQLEHQAWESIDARIQRWWVEVLPLFTSIVARLRARHATGWVRLEPDRSVNHGAEVAAKAWRSINAELVQWRDEVLLPRIGSIAALLKARQENAWLRLADAKQRRKHRAQVERQAWESVDAEIMRWWDEVLTRSSVATEIQRRVESYRTRRSLPR